MLDAFLEQLSSFRTQTDSLQILRDKGWSHFEKLGLPGKKQEAFRYLPLRELYQQPLALAQDAAIDKASFAQAIFPESQHSHLVFVNGYLRLDLSDITAIPKQVQILSLNDAMRTHGSFLQNRFSKSISAEQDPLVALNLSMHGNGAFVYIPPKLSIEAPIQCLYVFHSQDQNTLTLTSPRLHLFLGAHSEVKWISTSHRSGPAQCFNALFDAAIEEGAQLNLCTRIAASDKDWHFESLRASLKANSRLSSISVSTGGACARQDYRVTLNGEGAEAKLQGLTLLKAKAQSHSHLLVEHVAPHTQSMQRFKTLLYDTTQSSFEGKILVRKEAQKTQAYQLNNNLLLDDRAIANAKPNLEIFADDVKASHGVTVAQLDNDLLFYLKTRGISENTAKNLLTAGFCKEIIQEIPHPLLAQEIEMLLNDPLNNAG